jgi:sarcosine oxidase subunit gamma
MCCSTLKEPVVTVDIDSPDAGSARATQPLVARGALDSYAQAFADLDGNISLRSLPLTRSYNVRVAPESAGAAALEAALGTPLPTVSRWSATESEGTILWLGPDEWLVLDPGNTPTMESTLRTAVQPHGGVVVEQSGQRISIIVTGDAPGLLAKGTAVDLHPSVFTFGSVRQTHLGQTIVVFLARSHDSTEIEILVRTSFARYLGDWILDAARDPLAYPAAS